MLHTLTTSDNIPSQVRIPRAPAGELHLRFDPPELLGRLVVLTPRLRVNLILYYGVLAPRAAWQSAVVPATTDVSTPRTGNHPGSLTGTRAARGCLGPERINGPS